MISFLRKLRRKSLTKANIKGVLLYAVGEIVLVVIGILIAVNINNWNNQRKFNEIENVSLSRLKEDIVNDINRYDYLIKRMSDRIDRSDSVLLLIQKQQSLEDRQGIISVHLINYFLPESNKTTYEEMLNTGRLYSLNNDSLRSEILFYFQLVDKWSTYIEKDNAQLRDMVIASDYNDYWLIQNAIRNDQNIDLKLYSWLKKNRSEELKNIEAMVLRTNRLFRSNVSRITFLQKNAIKLNNLLELELDSEN